MRYEPTKKAGVAPAHEIAKVTRQTPLDLVAVAGMVQCLDQGCKRMHTPALCCQISCLFVPRIISAGAGVFLRDHASMQL